MSKLHSPLDILQRFYDVERVYTSNPDAGQRDFEPVAAMFHKDFVMEQSSALPWAGTYHGPDGFKSFFDQAADWALIDVRDPEIFESPDSDKIMVLSTVHYVCHRTGETPHYPLAQTFVIDREQGLIKEIRAFYWDIQKLNKAMGYSG